MPSQSFKPRFIDALLSCEKQQTTRLAAPISKPPRIKINDIVQVYIEQRKSIISKPLRELTDLGYVVMGRLSFVGKKKYPALSPESYMYPAHFLGKIVIADLYDIVPAEMTGEDLEAWAWADNFKDFGDADAWFTKQYDSDWVTRVWTVQRWHGWLERYFNPTAVD